MLILRQFNKITIVDPSLSTALPIRGYIKDNLKIIFLVSGQKHML